MPMYSLYAAAKFAVVGFSESLSHELAPLGIRVKVFAPGAVATDFSGRSLASTFEGDGGPYADSIRKVMGVFAANRGTSNASTAEQLALALYEAATDGNTQLRYVIGDYATALMQTRKEIGEEALMGAMRQRFGLTA